MTTTRWLLLGLMLLAAVAFTSQPAYAVVGCTGSETPSSSAGINLGAGPLHVGTEYINGGLVTLHNTSTCDTGGGPVAEEITFAATAASVVPSCKTRTISCSLPDTGVITITTASSAAGECGAGAITWTVGSGGPGVYTFTNPGGPILIPGDGRCLIHFTFDADALPTVDAVTSNDSPTPTLDTGQTVDSNAQTDSGKDASGAGDNNIAFGFTCGVKIDKQISCDGGQTWFDSTNNTTGETDTSTNFQTANGDGTNGCIGKAGATDIGAGVDGILVRYAVQNTSDSNLTLSSCSITDSSNTGAASYAFSGGIAGPFTVNNGGLACTAGTFVSGCGGASTTSTGFSITGEPTTPVECMAAGPGTDTATVNCICNAPPAVDKLGTSCSVDADCATGFACVSGGCEPKVTANDSAEFGCCGVEVDKQVSCDGTNFTDIGFETNNGDGTKSCTGQVGSAAAIRYQIENIGNLDLTCSGAASDGVTQLGLVDLYVGTTCSVDADCPSPSLHCVTGECAALTLTGEGPITGGTFSGGVFTSDVFPTLTTYITNSNVTTCSSNLNTLESKGNQATILCECTGSFHNTVHLEASATDSAQIQCNTSGFTLTKTCTPSATTAGQFATDAKVTNTGTNALNCTITDQYVTGVSMSSTCPLSGGTTVPLSPACATGNTNAACINVSGSPANCSGTTCATSDGTGTITGLAVSSTNEACATCSVTGPTCAVAADCAAITGATAACVTGACQYTTNNAATANCTIGTCFTRTPGYWGTHPDVTQQVLTEAGGSVTDCNDSFNNTNAGAVHSTTEAICESGLDAKNGKGNSFYTSPQQLQLIRQCTAAALNLAASGSGSIGGGLGACSTFLTPTQWNFCCGTGTDLCSSGASGNTIATSDCLTILDAFNSQESGTFSQVGLTNSKADPTQCKLANGNGLTDCISDHLGGPINCGTK